MRKSDEIKSDIEKVQRSINSPSTPENFKPKLKEKLEKLEAELSEVDSKPAPEAKEKKKHAGKKKPATKAHTSGLATGQRYDSKKKKGRKSNDTAMIDGKEYNVDSPEFCDALQAQFLRRRTAAKKNQSKVKTASIFTTVVSKVGGTALKAVRNDLRQNKVEANQNPGRFINKYDRLRTETKNYIKTFKSIVGDEYDPTELNEIEKGFDDVIDRLEKKKAAKA